MVELLDASIRGLTPAELLHRSQPTPSTPQRGLDSSHVASVDMEGQLSPPCEARNR
jgi:hypothetical protein